MPIYTPIPADLTKDRETILGVWRRNLSSTERLEEKYQWHFLTNPQGPAHCWLLLADGQPVGTVGLGMRAIQVGRTVERGGVACDLAVDQNHRFLQPALLLQKAAAAGAVKAGVRLLYGLPNGNGAATVRRIGYRDAGAVHRYVRLIRPSHYLARHPRVPSWTRFAAPLVDAMYQTTTLRASLGREYAVEIDPGFDRRFDELWTQRAEDFPVATVRDSQYLQWRFAECPIQKYSTIALLTRDRKRLLAYAIYYTDGSHMMLTDLLTTGQPADAQALFAVLLRQARRAGVASVMTQSRLPEPEFSALWKSGFRQRTEAAPDRQGKRGGAVTRPPQAGRSLLVYSDHISEPALVKPWYFTAGDEPYN